jgi:hypothetical protein
VTSRPTHTFGEILVVHEGAAGVPCQPTGDDMQTPVQLWPGLSDRRQLGEHLERGAPLLVVLPFVDAQVVPTLDWLPEPHSARGLQLLAACKEWVRTIPGPLVPPLLLDSMLDAVATAEPVRFAWQTSDLAFPEHAWHKVVRYMFGTAMTEAREDAPQRPAELPGATR